MRLHVNWVQVGTSALGLVIFCLSLTIREPDVQFARPLPKQGPVDSFNLFLLTGGRDCTLAEAWPDGQVSTWVVARRSGQLEGMDFDTAWRDGNAGLIRVEYICQ